jgi:hypothetical protein
MGNGPERAWLKQAIAGQPWIHYVGSKYGREGALFYKIANVFLLAGRAGLAVVDSFAAGLPLIATELPTHPPEVGYLTFWARSRVLVTGGSATKGGRAPKANPPHWNKIYARVTRRKGCLGLNKQVGTLYEGISA